MKTDILQKLWSVPVCKKPTPEFAFIDIQDAYCDWVIKFIYKEKKTY